MNEEVTWRDLFFSSNPPESFKREITGQTEFPRFRPAEENWKLGDLVDTSRLTKENNIQVFWLRSKGRRRYIGKVFPDFTEGQATEQLHRLGVSKREIPRSVNDAVHEFDRFFREARAYSHIDRFCPTRERIYFPSFYGVVTDMGRSRFSSGYAHRRAVVLEAIKPHLCSRRVLGEDVTNLPESFLETLRNLQLSPLEHEWYCSLLNDRLRRLNALHKIGVTYGDVKDCHFRLPGDIYDTVLYDFSESYTFSDKQPFRVSSGRPRSLRRIAEGERKRVELQVEKRAAARDFRSHLIELSSERDVDDVLWKSLKEDEESLELIILRLHNRPDCFSMPSLNSIFPFLEAVRPKSDSCWQIRRGRLLHYYESVWAVFRDLKDQPASIFFNWEVQLETVEIHDSTSFMLCLVPKLWIQTSDANHDSRMKDSYRT